MHMIYRWWDRYRVMLALTLLAIGVAWTVRETNGTSLMELYRLARLPFQENVSQQQQYLDAQTAELQQRLVELESQNQMLQTLIDQPVVQQQRAIIAPVIGRSADHWWQQILLGQGKQAGIKVGSVVVAPGGVVGRVTRVSDHTSQVLLVTDPTSRIGVVIQGSRQMGILRGQTGKQAVLDFFEKDPNVRPGDVVMTSSLSSLFPAGLMVGRVKSMGTGPLANPEAVIELSSPIGSLEWVSVYLANQTSE